MEHRETWLEKESLHYIFHYKQGSYAEQFVNNVMEEQEKCFRDITDLLKIIPDKKIHYWLCDSRKEVAEKSNYGETNGLCCCQDGVATIYCVYSENIKCIGYHEDTQVLSCIWVLLIISFCHIQPFKGSLTNHEIIGYP